MKQALRQHRHLLPQSFQEILHELRGLRMVVWDGVRGVVLAQNLELRVVGWVG